MTRPKKGAGERQRRAFTIEFKREAVRQLESGDHSVSDVARQLGIRRENLIQWQRQFASKAKTRVARRPIALAASEESSEQELRRLRKRVAQLEEEQEILGKAMAFFAKRHG